MVLTKSEDFHYRLNKNYVVNKFTRKMPIGFHSIVNKYKLIAHIVKWINGKLNSYFFLR